MAKYKRNHSSTYFQMSPYGFVYCIISSYNTGVYIKDSILHILTSIISIHDTHSLKHDYLILYYIAHAFFCLKRPIWKTGIDAWTVVIKLQLQTYFCASMTKYIHTGISHTYAPPEIKFSLYSWSNREYRGSIHTEIFFFPHRFITLGKCEKILEKLPWPAMHAHKIFLYEAISDLKHRSQGSVESNSFSFAE